MDLTELEQKLIELHITGKDKVLDLGCATGSNLVYFSKKGFDITGLDLSDEMIAKAKENLGKYNLNVNIVKGSICAMDMLSDNSFDYVLCMFVLMNLKEENLRKQAMNEMKRVCKLDGKIMLMVHNSNEGKVILGDWFDRKFEYRIFTEKEIKELITATGLKLEKIQIVGEGKYIFAVCAKH